ncbi:hypothetical protein EON83_12640 [bacterium]|nr:MAG: hypothetical protein EON83_12640 [bacterium]
MKDGAQHYQDLLRVNQDAFTHELFLMSYHSLSAALACAIALKDRAMLKEVESMAHSQWQHLKTHFGNSILLDEPLEVTLYSSLCQLANLRGLIF